MKRSPFGAVSVRPLRLMLTPPLPCCTDETNTFCTWFDSPDTDSTKNTRSLFAVSPNTPGVTRETSSRGVAVELGDAVLLVTEFDRYAARIETRENLQPDRSTKNMSTWALMTHPSKEKPAEVGWRRGDPSV